MLSIDGAGSRLCDGWTRREWLRVGGLSLFGLTGPALRSARASGTIGERGGAGRARSCILFYLAGGPPQHETWDPKPDASAEIRGELRPIATSVPGLFVGELMPRVARLAHRCSVLRAVTTHDNSHGSSVYYTLTGQPHSPGNTETVRVGAPNDFPCLGAVVRHLRPGVGPLPAAITLPRRMFGNDFAVPPGQDAGFLGQKADPWLLNCDLADAGLPVPDLGLPADIPPLRLDGRRSLLARIHGHLDAMNRGGLVDRFDAQNRQAFDLLSSPSTRRAFDLDREDPRIRDRYGRHPIGQGTLLARRLVEAGVGLVQVNWPREKGDMQTNNPLWDTHSNNAARLKTALMPPMDQTFSALLEDLEDRGMLEETLVVWMGEFGRSPRINGQAGRDHWGHAFSVAMAGGGIRGGQVHGATDRIGGYPKEGQVEPQDLIATIYHCLGIRPETQIADPLGRPSPISRGRVIREILA
jgi:Protein of unknown function (DUF1501)